MIADGIRFVLLAGAYLVLVGGAVRLVMARVGVTLPRGLGLTVGLGAGVGATVVGLAYGLFDRAGAAVVPAAVLALLTVGAVLLPRSPMAPADAGERRRLLATLVPHPDDLLAVAVAVLALGPLLRFGLTYWTAGINDFPSYAASVQVWESESAFRTDHPDGFGTLMVGRAQGEKPMVTALLLLLERVTGLPTAVALTPVMALGLFVLAGALLAVVRSHLPGSGLAGRLVALVPVFSVVPMSRVFHAQVGQVLAGALALVAVALLASASASSVPSAAGRWAAGGMAGVALAAAVGSNATLVLASAPTLVALVAWLAALVGTPLREVLWHWARAGLVAVAVSLPLVAGYVPSMRRQTSGIDGSDVPLGSPLALLGLQTTLADTPGGRRAVLLWLVLLAAAAAAYVVYRRRHPGPARTAILLAVGVLNGAAIVAVRGPDSYSAHKWLAFALWVLVPFVLARLIEVIPSKPHWKAVAAGGLASAAVVTCWAASSSVAYVVPAELVALVGDERFEAAEVVNIDLGNQYENSIAALVIDRPTVIAGASYGGASPWQGDWMLTRASTVPDTPADEVVQLNDAFALVDVDLELGIGTIGFDAARPWTRAFLRGDWHAADSLGTWSSEEITSIALDVADDLRGRDLRLTLTGSRYSGAGDLRTVTVVVHGVPSVSTTFPGDSAPLETVVVVPAEVVDAADGRVVVQIEAPDVVSPSDLGLPDTRRLGYRLISLSVSPD